MDLLFGSLGSYVALKFGVQCTGCSIYIGCQLFTSAIDHKQLFTVKTDRNQVGRLAAGQRKILIYIIENVHSSSDIMRTNNILLVIGIYP